MINQSMDTLEWLCKQLETDGNDLLREMVRSFAEALMGADAGMEPSVGSVGDSYENA